MEQLDGPGQEHDSIRAEELLGDHQPRPFIADKGYDFDLYVATAKCHSEEVVIPPQSNRLKHYRRVAARYEKKARNYVAFAQFAATLILHNVNVNAT